MWNWLYYKTYCILSTTVTKNVKLTVPYGKSKLELFNSLKTSIKNFIKGLKYVKSYKLKIESNQYKHGNDLYEHRKR